MEKYILEYLQQNWSDTHTDKIILSPVPKNALGDLALNVFGLTKVLQKSPPEILMEIKTILEGADFLEKSEIAGPYLNLFFKNNTFFKEVLQTPTQTAVLKDKKIVIEFSGPNTNKPLHLGHMRNHALGISVANILEKSGANVSRVNIINDRGMHICKSMLAYKLFGNDETPESTGKKPDHFVGDFYVRFETESKKDASLLAQVQEMLVAWEKGDPETLKLWKQMNDWTLSGHQTTYDRQGIKFIKNYFESETYTQGKTIAEEGLSKNVFEEREDGAIVINFEDENLGQKVILRADGTSIYLTNDLAVAEMRYTDFTPDEMIWVVCDEQNYHFKVLFECLDRLDILDKKHLCHLNYGLVNLPDGRMKSREGNVVDADNMMDELHEIAAHKIKENLSPTLSAEFTEDVIYKTAEQIQNAAWKYYLLRTTPNKVITFDSQKSIDFQGATGPYLQYAGVRIKSILSKISLQDDLLDKSSAIKSLGDDEKALGVKILAWPKTLNRAALEKNPTHIATYLIELAQIWSSFYAENSVLNAETDVLIQARCLLAQKVLDILTVGLDCLGVEIPEKM